MQNLLMLLPLVAGLASANPETTFVLPGGATMEMVWIEPGTFIMGSPGWDEVTRDDEKPPHEVTITRGYWIGKYEVTEDQWMRAIEGQPWDSVEHPEYFFDPDEHWVESWIWNWPDPEMPQSVYWDEAQIFIAKLNEFESAEVYRLPTEAEWEYACRAGTTTRWWWTDSWDSFLRGFKGYPQIWWSYTVGHWPENVANRVPAIRPSGKPLIVVDGGYPRPVGMFLPNPWGLYDIAGNVSEWCQDWYGPYLDEPQTDPQGLETGEYHVGRGGHAGGEGSMARSAARQREGTFRKGFRVVGMDEVIQVYVANRVAFGYVPLNSVREQDLLIRNTGSRDLTVFSVVVTDSESGMFTMGTFTPNTVVPPGDSISVMLFFTPADTSDHIGKVTLKSNAPGADTTKVVILRGTGTLSLIGTTVTAETERITAHPDSTSVITVIPMDAQGRRIDPNFITVMLSTTDGMFEDDGTTVQAMHQGDSTYTAILHAADIAKKATILATVSGRKIMDTATVTFVPAHVEMPRALVFPSSVDFGLVRVGTLKKDTVVVWNDGGATLVLTNVSTETTRFDAVPESMIVPYTETGTIEVTFAPPDTGSFIDTLNFVTNDPIQRKVSIALAGEGMFESTTLRVPSAYSTIQAAINAAVDGDTVLVADETYTGTGNKGLEFKGKAIVVTSENGPEVTIIDCEGSTRGFNFRRGEDSRSVLKGFTIKNGSKATYGGGIECFGSSPTIIHNIFSNNSAEYGGGIRCYDSSPMIINNTFSNNSADQRGGGICCRSSSPMIINNTFSGNFARYRGGGINCSTNSSPTITDNTFSGNSAMHGSGIRCSGSSLPRISHNIFSHNSGESGVGIFCCYNSSPMITHNTFSNNSADDYGGAIYCEENSSPTIIHNAFSGNSAKSGGGILCCANSFPTITHNTFSGNSVRYRGGGIYCWDSSSPMMTIMITHNIFSGNSAKVGGGIRCYNSSPMIINNIFFGNLADDYGGGICCWGSSPTIINSTFSSNSADDYGGGICCEENSSPTVLNTILWGNRPDEIYLSSSTITVTYSDIQGGYTGEGNIEADPLFVGPDTSDYHLQAGSPCTDAGNPSSPLDPDGTRADMGALYYHQSAPSRLYGDVTGNGEVTEHDASWVLQHAAGLRTLIGEDSTAADVSGRMGISAYDASLILQYVVGKISVFPVEQGGVPDLISRALMYPRTVSIGRVTAQPHGRLSIPILIDDMDGIVAGEMTLSFSGNTGDVTISTSKLTDGYLLAHNVRNGRIRASFAGAESSTGPGPVLEMMFDASDAEVLSSLRLERVSLNEGRIPVQIAKEVGVPAAYRLGQNYPNPFNPETTIRYDVAETGPVRLAIYALTGQRVRTLVDKQRSAGRYAVIWDGTDDAGWDVASSVYLCRMVAGNYRSVRKMLLIR